MIQENITDYYNTILNGICDKIDKVDDNNSLKEVKEYIDDCRDDLSLFIEYLKDDYSHGTVNSLDLFSPAGLAFMAYMSVSMTALKRRASTDLNTVGGFVNVGYLSVNDGFKWIRKERYYNQNLDFLKFE